VNINLNLFLAVYLHWVCYSYGGGTHPWNRTAGGIEPATDDGLIEVVGLTTYQLVSKFRKSYKHFIGIFKQDALLPSRETCLKQ
jgi:hypothetical protein